MHKVRRSIQDKIKQFGKANNIVSNLEDKLKLKEEKFSRKLKKTEKESSRNPEIEGIKRINF